MIDDETFFAWLDGELDADRADEVGRAVAADLALSRKAEAHRRMGARLRQGFDPLMSGPVPDRLAGAPIDFAAAKERHRARGFASPLPAWASLAATLVVGLVGGAMLTRGGVPDNAPVQVEGGQLVAAAALDKALDVQLASAGQAQGIRVGLTFTGKDGATCRTFANLGTSSGLACREGNTWRVRGLFGGEAGPSGQYRLAAGEDPRLAALVDETIVGDPYDAAQERAARERGWK